MGLEHIITIWVESYNPFCNTNPSCNKTLSLYEKRKYIILNRMEQVMNLSIVFYHYEIDLNTTVFKTLLMGVYFCFHQNLSNYYNATKSVT